MLTPLRREIQQLMADIPVRRKSALRRSDAPGALLALELPLVADAQAVDMFMARAESAGWRVFPLVNGWLALDHPVPEPTLDVPDIPGDETGCCLSLLLRHPGGPPEESYIRAMVKADDAGKAAVMKLCRAWHEDFAAKLRRHEPLPGVLPWLCQAIRHHEESSR